MTLQQMTAIGTTVGADRADYLKMKSIYMIKERAQL